MKIGVCIKQVPSSDAPLRINPDRNWIEETGANFEVNEPDLFALEEALRLRDELGGDVVVISLGPERVKQVIRDALARGADRGIQIVHEAPHTLEPLHVAACIADIAREEGFDLVLAGLQSGDLGYSQTGTLVAELLGHPHAGLVVEIQSHPDGLRVRRELEGGAFQWIGVPLPCTLGVQSGINKPRYAGMKGIMAAKKKEIKGIPAEVPEETAAMHTLSTREIFIPDKSAQTEYIQGSPEEVCTALADRLGKAMGVR